MCVCMHACMYVCIYTYIYILTLNPFRLYRLLVWWKVIYGPLNCKSISASESPPTSASEPPTMCAFVQMICTKARSVHSLHLLARTIRVYASLLNPKP